MHQSSILYNKSQIHSDFLDEDIWNLLDETYTVPQMFNFNVFKIKEEKYIGRPDLISLDTYGDPVFADVICKINGISNPFELNVGNIIMVPSQEDVVNFPHPAPIDEKEGENEIVKPTPKSKKEKRSANEAIVGDKRFKIDSAKRIVIY